MKDVSAVTTGHEEMNFWKFFRNSFSYFEFLYFNYLLLIYFENCVYELEKAKGPHSKTSLL